MATSELTATSVALQLPELVALVVDQLQTDRQSLARLARVSSTFHRPSIKHLWSRAHDVLNHLLRLLPDGSAKPLHLHNDGSSWEPTMLAESDWARVHYYSFHVTSIYILSTLYAPTSIALLSGHNNSCQGTLFPRLETLSVYYTNARDYPHSRWMMLGGPSLQTLLVGGDGLKGSDSNYHIEAAFTLFCQDLVEMAPNIQRLSLVNFPNTLRQISQHLIAELCLSLQSLPSLQSFDFHVPWGTPSLLASCIATLPSISQVGLSEITTAFPKLEHDMQAFRSLQKLDLRGFWNAMGSYMQVIPHSHLLRAINLRFLDIRPPSAEAFVPLGRLFKTATNLTSVRLGYSTLTWENLQPLLAIKSISTFSAHPNLADLDDKGLADLAFAWRDLEHLEVSKNGRPPTHYQVSLLGLAPLVKFCPKLKLLAIELTTRDLGSQGSIQDGGPSAVPDVRNRDGCMNFLDLCYSEISETNDDDGFPGPQRTADMLMAMWPSLRYPDVPVTSTWAMAMKRSNSPTTLMATMTECWSKVEILLKGSESS